MRLLPCREAICHIGDMMLRPLALALALAAAPAAAQLSAPEQRIAATVDAEQERNVALLQRLVDQNSGSLNVAGVTKVGEMMRAELEPLGFTVQWIDMKETGRAGHIVATHKGKPGTKRMLLIGHLDTVFEPSSAFQKFERKGDTATGPGVGDDKGGMVVIVAALRAMQTAGTLKDANIEVVLTGDEERTGEPTSVARRDLIAAGKRADVSLEFEGLVRDEQGRDYGTVARRGSISWTVKTTGKPGHSSGVFGPGLGYGAAYELARILDGFRRELAEPNLTYNVGVMAAGTPATLADNAYQVSAEGKTNMVAGSAVARGDLRALTLEQAERAQAKMTAIVGQHLAGTSATISFADGYPPMSPTAGNRALLTRLNGVNKDLGWGEMTEWDPAKRGAADSSWVAADTDVLAGLGTAGDGAHAEGESVDLTSIPLQAKRAAILMTRLSREKR